MVETSCNYLEKLIWQYGVNSQQIEQQSVSRFTKMTIGQTSIETYFGIGFFFFFTITCVFGNGLALYLLIGSKKKKVADLLLIHLCFCEGLGALWGIVDFSLAVHVKTYSRNLLFVVGEVVIYVSVYETLICITVDRFLALKYNLRYRSIVTKKRFFVLLPAIWVLSASLAVICALTPTKVYYVMWSVLDVFTVVTLVTTYSYIIITVRKQKRIFKGNSSWRSQFKYQIPLCICLTYLILIFIPNLILSIKSDLPILWFNVLLYINYCCDPLIYVLFSLYERRRKKKLSANARNIDSTKSRNSDIEMIVISSSTMQPE